MTDATAIIANTGTAFQHLPADVQRAKVQEMAQRIVSQEVRYCVSSLVATLQKREWDGSEGFDPDDLISLSYAEPDADDYREAAREAGVFDAPPGTATADARRIDVARDRFNVWCFTTTDEDGDEDDRGTGYDGTEAGAWRAGFDSLGIDHPDGHECLEHWLVTEWLAEKLKARGERVVDDLAGLTVWGRCTSGQAIYADHVLESIARDLLA